MQTRFFGTLLALGFTFLFAQPSSGQTARVSCATHFARSSPLGRSNLDALAYERERGRFALSEPRERGARLVDRLTESGRTGSTRAEILLAFVDSFAPESERLGPIVDVTLGRVRFVGTMDAFGLLSAGRWTSWTARISGSRIKVPTGRIPDADRAIRLAWSFAVSIREMAFAFQFIPRRHGRHSVPICSTTRLCAETDPAVVRAEAAEDVGLVAARAPGVESRSPSLRFQLPARFAENVLTDLERIEGRLYRLRQALMESAPNTQLPGLSASDRDSTVALSEALPTVAIAGVAGTISFHATRLMTEFLTIVQPERALELASGNAYVGPICVGVTAGAFVLSLRYSALRGHCLSESSFERWRGGGPAISPSAQSTLGRRLRSYWVTSNFVRATVLASAMASAVAIPTLISEAYTYRDHMSVLIERARQWATEEHMENASRIFEDNVLSSARAMQLDLTDQIREMEATAASANDVSFQNRLRMRQRMLRQEIEAHGDLR